jgi:lysophospholipase L1-like esterase
MLSGNPIQTPFQAAVDTAANPTVQPIPEITTSFILNQQPAPQGIGDEYLALGDSVAYGVGAPTPSELGYAGLFFNNYLKRVKPALPFYKNLAIPGETSDTFFNPKKGKSQLQQALDEIEAAKKAGRSVSPITLTLGGNDMLENRRTSEAERATALNNFEKNLRRALDDLKTAAGNSTDFIVTTYYNPYIYQTGGGTTDTETAWVTRFNDIIRKVAADRGARVADFFTPLYQQEGSYTWIKFGDVHPNGAGHSLLAQALWQSSGYDREAPTLSLSYNGLPNGRKLLNGERVAFKIAAAETPTSDKQVETIGVGSVPIATVRLDNGTKLPMARVPLTYLAKKAVPEFTWIMDTTGLTPGPHTIQFEAIDVAGNSGNLEIYFEVSS